jgi:gluconate kinase
MLDSQFADLEPPAPDEDVLTVSAGDSPKVIVDEIIEAMQSHDAKPA